LPGSVTAPPITKSAFARMKVWGDRAAARAKVVRGPMAIRVIVSGGFVERISRMREGEGVGEGLKRWECEGGVVWVVDVAVAVRMSSEGGWGGVGSKRWSQVSAGEL